MTEAESSSASARLLAYAPGHAVAFSEHCAVALTPTPEIFEVPGRRVHCLGLIEWTGKLLPLIDLRLLIEGEAPGEPRLSNHVLILAWQPAPGQALQYGAVCAPTLVTGIRVSDAQRREVPANEPVLASLAGSFFERDGGIVPIVETRRLFGARLPSFTTSSELGNDATYLG